MNKVRIKSLMVVALVFIWTSGALAVPPPEKDGVIQALQAQIDNLQSQIDNSQAVGTRVSAVDNSAQTINNTVMDLANEETFISLSVTTATEGTFVMGFSSRTDVFGCLVGLGGPCGEISVSQRIYLDGQMIGDVRSPRVFDVGGGLNKPITSTASASEIPAGEHSIEVKVACTVAGQPTDCVSEGYSVSAHFETLWAVHPK
jgi:hypothetical protein